MLRELDAIQCAQAAVMSIIDRIDVTEEAWYAANRIQTRWRQKRARAMVISLIHSSYQKCFDEARDTFYYMNLRTGESQWVRPLMLVPINADIGKQVKLILN